jgi:uncharacterized membrane protein YidH (DUF202 family)
VRGRAGGAALPALVVFALVAIVAVAATGSVPRGSNESRAPSETLLDTLFTLWIVTIVAGGILLVYGLLQRQAIAKQVARSRYRRVSVVEWLALWTLLVVVVWAFTRRRPHGFSPANEESPFGAPGEPVQPTPDDKTLIPYEPSVNWVTIAVVVALVAAAIAYVVASRRARQPRDHQGELAEELASALDDALDDLRAETDPRKAIIAAYASLERVLAANGAPRIRSETADEYLVRVLHDLELTPEAIGRLTALFTQAKFSHHAVDTSMKESAIAALEQVRDELRALRDAPPTVEPHAQALTS